MACIGTPATVPSVRKVTSTSCAPSDFTTRYVVTLPFSSPNSSPIISDLLWIRFARYVAETYVRRVDSSEAFRVNRNPLQLACLNASRDDASQIFFVRWPTDNLHPTAPFPKQRFSGRLDAHRSSRRTSRRESYALLCP